MASHGPRRPRSVADLDAPDARTLAKGWLLGLVAALPLDRSATLPVAELAEEGPALCAAVLAAVGTDRALERLAPGGDLHGRAAAAGRLAGGREPADAVTAAEALRGAVLEALPHEQRELAADRLAHVCSLVAAAGAAALAVPEVRRVAAPGGAAPATHRVPPGDASSPAPHLVPPGDASSPAPHRVPPPPGLAAVPWPEEQPDGAPWPAADGAARDPWTAAIARRLAAGRPFGVLVVEVDDVDRLVAAHEPQQLRPALDAAERAVMSVAQELAPLRDGDGRWWLVGPVTDAQALGERLAAEVAAGAALGGAPLRASVGVALAPQDGEGVDALVARAEEGLYAARAAGVPVA